MNPRPIAAFLDFATLGPGVDTSRLDGLAEARYYDYSGPAEVAARIADCRVAIVNKARLDRDAIGGAAELELVVIAATGTDNVDTAAAADCGVAVANIRDYCSTSVAQHVFALVLGLTQRIGPYDGLVRSGLWTRSRSFALFDYPIRELSGRVLGVVGYGSLGRGVARLAEALGMRVLVSARPGATGPVPSERTPFDALLEQADVLSLHCPLTPATRHLIGAPELGRMRRDALLINTARGALVDEAALAEALRRGEIAGAGVDVLSVEPPPPDHPLLSRDIPNLILTPHIAWAAQEARQRALDQVAEDVESFLAGATLRRVV